jgi:hypothetical protein
MKNCGLKKGMGIITARQLSEIGAGTVSGSGSDAGSVSESGFRRRIRGIAQAISFP